MNTELRFVLAVVLVVGVLVVTNILFPPVKRPTPLVSRADSASTAAVPPRTGATLSPSGLATDTSAGGGAVSTAESVREIVVEGPLYRHVFSTRGARLVSSELLPFKSFTRSGSVQLVGDSAQGVFGFRLQSGRDTVDLRGAAFTPSSERIELGDGPTELTFTHVEAGLSVEITYTFRPADYVVHVRGTVQGLDRPLLITDMGSGLPLNDQDKTAEGRALAYVGNHLQKGVETRPLTGVKAAAVEEGPFVWAAQKSKFFVLALMRENADSAGGAQFGGLLVRPLSPGRVDVAATQAVGNDGHFGYRAYLGPLEIPRLAAQGDDFDEVNQYRPAFLRAMVRPLVGLITSVLDFLHDRLKLGYGWVLVLFGLLMRVLLWPFNQKAMRAQMHNMAVQPLIKDIQTKYKDKPEKLQQEMLKLYKEHGFNPLAGCLPMLLPYPILISLYFVFQYAIGLRGVPFGWLPDLSAPDPIFVLPILLGASMFLLQWIGMRSMPDPNPQMKMMMWMMPLMMMFIFYRFAAGLNLYYAVSNFATIPQQIWIAKERQKVKAQPVPRAR